MRCFCAVVLGFVATLATPHLACAQGANPFEGDPDAISAGGVLFASRCTECHGADAQGLSGPDLTALWVSGATDARVFGTIRAGVTDSIMPPSTAPDAEIWAIVAYLRSISTVPPWDHPAGNGMIGREVFAAHCAACHRVDGAGAALGPDLSRIAEVRSLESLMRAIRDPDETIAPDYRTVTLVTRDRDRVRGIVKAEDAFSIQVVDLEQRLVAYRKSDLRDIVRESASLMSELDPDALTREEFDDLLAFLATLRNDAESL